ncbi:hypothetical protein ABW19_dt0202123 [Dactylella cylindrospora]|nr:hypothetical protein ABW19_dt0202123 [Dactylella cylindrospora]
MFCWPQALRPPRIILLPLFQLIRFGRLDHFASSQCNEAINHLPLGTTLATVRDLASEGFTCRKPSDNCFRNIPHPVVPRPVLNKSVNASCSNGGNYHPNNLL